MKKVKDLKMVIDGESLDIFIDKGDDQKPIDVCYWHFDEVDEDGNVAISILNAIRLFYTDQVKLCELVGKEFLEEEV